MNNLRSSKYTRCSSLVDGVNVNLMERLSTSEGIVSDNVACANEVLVTFTPLIYDDEYNCTFKVSPFVKKYPSKLRVLPQSALVIGMSIFTVHALVLVAIFFNRNDLFPICASLFVTLKLDTA